MKSKIIHSHGVIAFFTCFAAMVSVSCQAVANKWISDPILVTAKSYPISSIHEVKVTTSGGSISVSGDAEQQAVLEMNVNPNGGRNLSKAEIQEILDRDYDISIQQRGGVLEASAKRKKNLNWRNTLNISFTIRTGRQVQTDLVTSGGSIKLSGLSGTQVFKTSGGSLDVTKVKGRVVGKTSGGSIQLYDSEGNLDLSTSGGSIKFGHLNGDVHLSTSGGSIKGQSAAGSLQAKTSGGSIDLDDLACKLQASTSGGSITAVLHKLPGDVRLSTSAGNVNLTLPKGASANVNLVGGKVNTHGLSNFNGNNSKGRLEGSINGGGANVQASTSAGSVNLDFN